ncbi:MAG TPA: efflux transporter outer membrane subunit [Caulobacterales bacterium]|nr:efflux transporter outer membrane subunit [Caulobacterales bacterium]
MSVQTGQKWLMVSLAAMLAACASPPDLGPTSEPAPASDFTATRSFAAPQADWPSDHWWTAFGDAQLSALIEEALADSPSLVIASARVHQAQAIAQQSGAALSPTLGAQSGANATRQHLSADNLPPDIANALPNDWSTTSNAALKLDYQLDFFGRNRAAFAGATSHVKAAEAEAAEARLQLSTSVALAYGELLRLSADLDAAEHAAATRETSARLVQSRVASGLENEGHAHQAASEAARARAEVLAVRAAVLRARHQIAALLGKGPDRGLAIAAPRQPGALALGLPASAQVDLIGRRPDLAAARFNAAAAAQHIRVARADFYPNINLSALVSYQTLGIDAIGGGQLSAAQAGPAVSLPIFTGGRLQGEYRGARAQYDEAVALYNQTLANAMREVADAYSDRAALEGQLAEQRAALQDAEQSYRIARTRYEGGLASYIDTLSVENALIAQQRAVANLNAQAFALDVTLVRALGGGFIAS